MILNVILRRTGLLQIGGRCIAGANRKQASPGKQMAFGQPISLMLGSLAFYFGGTIFAAPQNRDISQDFEKCKIIADDRARLNCLKSLLAKDSTDPSASPVADSWR